MEARICYFLAICRYGSFRAAARACGVSTPAVSMGVARLEHALGARLFERRRPVRLTPLGRELRPMLEEMHGIAGRIDRALARPPAPPPHGTAAARGRDGDAAG